MDKSAILSRYETADHRGYEFDYQPDFTQFLEAERKNAEQATPDTAHLEETLKKQLDWEKKNSKSWKNSLFSWLKTDKKSKFTKQLTNDATLVSKTRRGPVPGPAEGLEATVGGVRGRAQFAASGPLIGFFNSARRQDEYEVPYMCLGQLNNPQKLQCYGPIYSVT